MRGKQRNKFHAKKITINGTQFDSRAEAAYYLKLEREGAAYMRQEKFELVPRYRLNGKSYQARTYRPGLSIYDGERLVKAVDVKGGRATMTTDAKLRIVAFMEKYRVPVIVARYDYKTSLF